VLDADIIGRFQYCCLSAIVSLSLGAGMKRRAD
jgi:hypothetical protein